MPMFRLSRFIVIVGLVLCVGVFAPLAAAQEANSTTHVIQPGENLFRIAMQYGLTTTELAAANDITSAGTIYAGQTLVIPTEDTPPAEDDPTDNDTSADAETDESPAPEADTPAEDANPTENDASEDLITQPVYHTVQRGQTLGTIAQLHGITAADLIAQNGLTNPNRILAGQQLIVGETVSETAPSANPAAPATEEELAALAAESGVTIEAEADAIAPEDVESITHTVQTGEYLSSIARQYDVSPQMILAMNDIINPDTLYAGQQLLIPSDLTDEEAEAIIYAPPEAAVGTGREIVVDLSNSRVYAYDNGILLYEAVSSNGLPATPTVQGEFTVRTKVRSQTMSGPGYWLPNVEWVLYFYQGYALHGAYWHDNWGQPMSHGCVNLPNEDAKWFYEFVEVGTPVTVQF